MTEIPVDLQDAEPGVSVEVILAGACLGIGFAAASFIVDGPHNGITFAVLAGWCAFAVGGGLLLDRDPGASDGRFLLLLSLVPVLTIGWAVARTGSVPDAVELTEVLRELSGLEAGLVAVALPWVSCRPARSNVLTGAALLTAAGGVLVATARALDLGAVAVAAGWTLVSAGAVATWVDLLVQASTFDRNRRRRTIWLVGTLAGAGLAVGVTWLVLPTDAAAYVSLASLVLIALLATRLRLVTTFRPVDEPLLDALAGVGALLSAALIGGLVRAGAAWIDLPSPATPAAFGALLTLGFSAPAAVWLRRSAMESRYGTGVISSSDVALITADLRTQTDPRELLDKAARMVAAASGSPDVRIVLGSDPPEPSPNEVQERLVVGGDQVGVLVVLPADREGLEPRQHQVIEQLVPTVALVARAVGLAVETEHARRDLTRERERERRRILNDLHDVLGPVLAGMSMRVRGALRTQDDPDVACLLDNLAADLATSRADLRRMVAGLTPSALDGGGLRAALDQLVDSFNGTPAGPRLSLDFAVEQELTMQVEVAVYRFVAEGVTNAVRHAGATLVAVRVGTTPAGVVAEVSDDGSGGPVHPGVGLTSLTQRAQGLGGNLDVAASTAGGVSLRLRLPLEQEVVP